MIRSVTSREFGKQYHCIPYDAVNTKIIKHSNANNIPVLYLFKFWTSNSAVIFHVQIYVKISYYMFKGHTTQNTTVCKIYENLWMRNTLNHFLLKELFRLHIICHLKSYVLLEKKKTGNGKSLGYKKNHVIYQKYNFCQVNCRFFSMKTTILNCYS